MILLCRYILACGTAILLMVHSNHALAADHRLENAQIKLTLDEHTGAIRRLENKLAGELYPMNDAVFKIQAGTGTTTGTLGFFGPEQCDLVKTDLQPESARFVFRKGPLDITLAYHLDPEDCFAAKRVRVEYSGGGSWNIRRFEMFDWDLPHRPLQAIPYHGFMPVLEGWLGDYFTSLKHVRDGEENPPSDNSTAFYFRYREGGIFTALTCDYVSMRQHPDNGRYQSVYWPGIILRPGQPFQSEDGIIGVYRRKGYVHPPYQPQRELYKFHYPSVDTRLDRAEIDAMKSAVQNYVEPGAYCTMVSGWCLGLPGLIEDRSTVDLYKQAIDTLSKLPEIRFLTQADPFCGMSREFARHGFDMPLKPNAFVKEVYEYAERKNLGFSMLVNISVPPEKPAWTDLFALGADGRRKTFDVAFSRQHEAFVEKAIGALKPRYNLRAMTYDGLVFETDDDVAHGYLPGRASLYPQYAFLRDATRRIHEKFPDLVLRGQGGHTALGPWLANYMSVVHNAHDHMLGEHRNFLDFHAGHHLSNIMRASDWFTSQCKMFPRYLMNSEVMQSGFQIRAWDYLAWEYTILSQLANSDNFGEIDNLPNEKEGEVFPAKDVQFLDKWLKWHQARRDYYRRARELFGEPRLTGVDGYAYGNGEDGLLFLCNPTFRSHPVSVPLNEETFLSPGRRYSIRELYPEERYRVGSENGAFVGGSSFVVEVPPQTVLVFEIKPDDPEAALLLGVEGTLQPTAKGWTLEGVKGPPGVERLIAVRLPRNSNGGEEVLLNGKPLPVRRVDELLLGRIHFDGEPIQAEVQDWRAEEKEGRLIIRARVPAPEGAREILASQRYPIAATYDQQKWLDQVAWLGAHRFIIYLPVLPPGVAADELTGDKIDALKSGFTPLARLNGASIPVHLNLQSDKGQRFAGFFIDATQAIRYGRLNDLELEFPSMTGEDRFFGIYLPNLTRSQTSAFTTLKPPRAIETVDIAEAADAFFPVPRVMDEDGRHIVNLRLVLTAARECKFDPSTISVQDGELTDLSVIGAEPRWLIDPSQAEKGFIQLNSKPKMVQFQVTGGEETKIILGRDRDARAISLGEILKRWREKNDRFDVTAMELNWAEQSTRVAVELVGPREHKLTVKSD